MTTSRSSARNLRALRLFRRFGFAFCGLGLAAVVVAHIASGETTVLAYIAAFLGLIATQVAYSSRVRSVQSGTAGGSRS